MTGILALRAVYRSALLSACLAAIVAASGAYAQGALSPPPIRGLLSGAGSADPAGRAGPSGLPVQLTQGSEPAEAAASDPAAPMAQSTNAVNPGAGSRLLRALEGGADGSRDESRPPSSSSPASSTPASGVPMPAAPASVVEGCPRDVLTRLLAGAAAREDALSALAIEHETLKLCHERQLIVTRIFEAEAQLLALRAPVEPPAAAINRFPVSVPAVMPQLSTAPTATPPLETSVPKPTKSAPKPSYGWFSIVGMAGELRAGVTDGQRVWFVREGDPLPGSVRVGRIDARPPGVRLKGGDDGVLAYRARPEDGQ